MSGSRWIFCKEFLGAGGAEITEILNAYNTIHHTVELNHFTIQEFLSAKIKAIQSESSNPYTNCRLRYLAAYRLYYHEKL